MPNLPRKRVWKLVDRGGDDDKPESVSSKVEAAASRDPAAAT